MTKTKLAVVLALVLVVVLGYWLMHRKASAPSMAPSPEQMTSSTGSPDKKAMEDRRASRVKALQGMKQQSGTGANQ